MLLLPGIAASNYSHVKYFPSRAAYDAFYEIILRVVNIAFEDFADYAQFLVVRYLRSVSDEAANWFEEWWTGARGRYCLCHAMHGGTNNNMGIEVDWRDIKKLCPPSATLPTFLGSLAHFITEIGKEHEEHLSSCGHPNAFICEPILHKRMWDALQDMHPKTLACTFILTGNGKKLESKFAERVLEISAIGETIAPLHIKIEAWHQDNLTNGIKVGYPHMEDIKSVLMPRQHILKTIDPVYSRSVEEVRAELRASKEAYVDLVLNNRHPADVRITACLDIYETFHHMERKATWGAVPWPCSCTASHTDCGCKHGALLTAVFDPTIKVPKEFVASEPALRKK